MSEVKNTMRDVFISALYERMAHDKTIFFLAADFGSPKLDKLRAEFGSRFINVGIAEQNLVNVAAGLALEGYSVYAYAIAPFLTMRAFEQIRINLALQAQLREVNVNLVGVGAGMGYDVSGPTHHCLEDISIMRTLPNVTVFSPSDWVCARDFVDYSLRVKKPKYLRFEGKPHTALCGAGKKVDIEKGFRVLKTGRDICFVATGYMVQQALSAACVLQAEGIDAGVVDMFLLKPAPEKDLFHILKNYPAVITLEEAFIGKGGLDSLIRNILSSALKPVVIVPMGFADSYSYEIGHRDELHRQHGLGQTDIVKKSLQLVRNDYAARK